MPDNVIEMTKLFEAREAAEATARLHEALCIAAEETATGALCTEGRAQLIAALVPGIGPGWRLAWSPTTETMHASALDAARELYKTGDAGVRAIQGLCTRFGVKKLADVPAKEGAALMAAVACATQAFPPA